MKLIFQITGGIFILEGSILIAYYQQSFLKLICGIVTIG